MLKFLILIFIVLENAKKILWPSKIGKDQTQEKTHFSVFDYQYRFFWIFLLDSITGILCWMQINFHKIKTSFDIQKLLTFILFHFNKCYIFHRNVVRKKYKIFYWLLWLIRLIFHFFFWIIFDSQFNWYKKKCFSKLIQNLFIEFWCAFQFISTAYNICVYVWDSGEIQTPCFIFSPA